MSHVLSGKRVVGATTRQTVLDAIRELGYRPNHVARNLRTRQSRMLAVVVPDITNPYYAVLTRGLADAVDAAGYGTFVCSTDGQHDRERKFFQDVMDRGADGVVFASGETASEITFGPAEQATPIVCIGDHLEHPMCDAVIPDDESGSREAAAFLAARGYSRIAMVQGPPRYGIARTAGFRAAMQAARVRVPAERMVRGDWTRKGGYQAMQTLMRLDPRPDAVFCANDLMAIGALDVAHELGLRVPEDVAIIGFDDVDAATIVTPQLTTVRNPAYEVGSAAGDLVLSRMSGRYAGAGRTVVLPCPLIERGTA
ncbi:LacI family DNA-binding transcriptional regulator [Nocardioides sp. TF02-7]|uniref:LacI family DNA-binding transcriptional regulator n=1 Tax=Nocardioides sp. TF02-7 TaxID=2917724 RepID=UPI001F059440|nr:LacI family DNA-binding transcriptional regulator [Nocardioides sp. TF02-7]UMG91563.1 LacI family transcriptional regulator [Nocardioides sp. TF02-7]